MIADKLSNMALYPELAEYADEIISFAKKMEEGIEAGRYELRGSDLFALVQRYESKEKANCRMESHKLYADLQYVYSGREIIYYDTVDELTVSEDLTPAKDNIFYAAKPDKCGIMLTSGMFGYYAPQDGHMPGIRVDGPEAVEKIVFKIRLK